MKKANPLFSIDEVSNKLKEETNATSIIGSCNSVYHIKSKASKLIESIIGKLSPGILIEFSTAGNFSNHQLLEYVLKEAGPSIVHISTWSLKEDSARAISDFKNKGMITELYAVFDSRIKTQDEKHYQLLKNKLDGVAFTKNHAKVMVIESEKLSVSIVGSANFTRNPRIEAGYIFCSYQSATFHVKWMKQLIKSTIV